MQLNLEQPLRNSHYLHRKSNWENATSDPHQKKKKKKRKEKRKKLYENVYNGHLLKYLN